MSTKTKAFSSDITVIEGERAVSAVISTTAVDRDREVLIPQGCNAKDFEKNPVIFLNHNYADFWGSDSTTEKLPIGKCVALKRGDDAISFKMVFAERPANHPEGAEWTPDTLLALYQQGVMSAFSVGFIPVEGRAATDKDVATFGADCRYVHSKWKLLEVSCVPLPANQEAVSLAVSKGILTQERADKLSKAFSNGVTTINEARKSAETEGGSQEKSDEKPAMATCSKCKKEFPPDDMTETDGVYTCSACAGEKAAEVEPETAPEPEVEKHVVREIEPADETIEVKRVHRILGGKTDTEKTVKYVTRQIRKMRGAIYAD
jgi:hypothetical protein